MTMVVAVVGIVVLVGVATLVGMSMDTEAQRVEWREVARERRLRNEEQRVLAEERRRLQQERLLLAEQQRRSCTHCPIRGRSARR